MKTGSYAYSGFGLEKAQEASGWDQPYRYSTKWQHASGLVDYGYRFYSPAWGRWINRDPIAENGGANLYAMVSNSPINGIDPYGLDAFDSISSGAAGWGDALTFGLTKYSREYFGEMFVGGDANEVVDYCSTAYNVGWWIGTVNGIAMDGAGLLNGAGKSGFYTTGKPAFDAAKATMPSVKFMNETLGGIILNRAEKLSLQVFNKPFNMKVWDWASAIFARNAKGTATVFEVGDNSASVWLRVEKKILEKRGIPIVPGFIN